MIKQLRLGLSYLCEHKFKCKFQNCLKPLCSCGSSIESSPYFLLLSTIKDFDCKMLEPTDSYLTKALFYDGTSFDTKANTLVLNTTIDYILSAERFEKPLFFRKNPCFFYAIAF